MSLFQSPPRTPEEIAASRPLDTPPDELLDVDEATWYEKVYRGPDAKQLTVRAVAMGAGLGFLLSFANLYVGLKTGWHLGMAITAAILSFALWQSFITVGMAKSQLSILENNCMASTASAASYATGGATISAFPALMMLSVSAENPGGTHFSPWTVFLWCLALGVLGTVMAVPLKRNMINHERLRFPTGVAAASTMQSLYSTGGEAIAKARALFYAAGIGGLLAVVRDLNIQKLLGNTAATDPGLIPGTSKIFNWLPAPAIGGKAFLMSDYNIKLDHSVALVAAGAMIGIRTCAWMLGGALFLSFVLTPMAMTAEWTNPAGKLVMAASSPAKAWKEIGLWLGAPMMVGAALTSFALQWRTIARAFSGLWGDKTSSGSAELDAKIAATEVPTSWFACGGLAAGIPVIALAHVLFGVPWYYGILAVLLAFVLGTVACRVTGETDVTPTGAMGKIVQLTYGGLMPQSATANLMTASMTSNTASASADLLTELKSGYLLGANPRRQFIAQLMGTLPGAIAVTLGYYLLVPDATALVGADGREPTFPAPAAQQWKAVAEVFKLGIGNFHPFAQQCIAAGLALGVTLALVEGFAPKDKKKFIPSSSGIGIGLILPFYYSLAFFIGAVIGLVAEKVNKPAAETYTIPVASGFIAGESILGVIIAAVNIFVIG